MTQTPATLVGPGEPERVAFALRLVRGRAKIKGLRVLDLACRIGSFAAAFHEAGAKVTAVEGRQSNLDYAQPGPLYLQGDVRDLPDLGTFDVTLCLGILYHLRANEAVELLREMRRFTRRFAVIDTHVGRAEGQVIVEGASYAGASNGEGINHPWAALTNSSSWWFTESALDAAIIAAGWKQIEHIPGPAWEGEREDRRWLVIA